MAIAASTVAIVASAQDQVAAGLACALEQRGSPVLYLDGPAAARLFTIRIMGSSADVRPSLPMFIRPSAWWWRGEEPATSDERFLFGEQYAAVWAAAALSSAVVINRPGHIGWPGHLTPGAIRPLLGPDARAATAELHASGPERVNIDGASCGAEQSDDGSTFVSWGQNAELAEGPIRDLPRGVPLRARKVNPHALYEVVTVVGTRAFSATSDPRTASLDLVPRSLELVNRVAVHFASVTWAVHGATAEPVRLNTNPHDGELRFAWGEVESALCEDLIA